jgi:hypothetical protein
MNISELERSLRQLRLGGMAAVLENRLRQAQAEPMAPIDLISCLVSDELARRSDRLLERRPKQARFRGHGLQEPDTAATPEWLSVGPIVVLL